MVLDNIKIIVARAKVFASMPRIDLALVLVVTGYGSVDPLIKASVLQILCPSIYFINI